MKEQYPKLIFGSLILIRRLFCISREIAEKNCKSLYIKLCDKTILSSLFSLSYTTLDLSNSTHTQKKNWGGKNEFREINLRDGVNFHNFRRICFRDLRSKLPK